MREFYHCLAVNEKMPLPAAGWFKVSRFILNSSSILKTTDLGFASGFLIVHLSLCLRIPSYPLLYNLTSQIVPVPNSLTCCLHTPSKYLSSFIISNFRLYLQIWLLTSENSTKTLSRAMYPDWGFRNRAFGHFPTFTEYVLSIVKSDFF